MSVWLKWRYINERIVWLHEHENIKILGLKFGSSKAIYANTNQSVEKVSDILYVVFIKVLLPSVIWPKFVISFVKYFATDLGGDAFDLPLPWWWVFSDESPQFLESHKCCPLFIENSIFFSSNASLFKAAIQLEVSNGLSDCCGIAMDLIDIRILFSDDCNHLWHCKLFICHSGSRRHQMHFEYDRWDFKN